METIAVYARLDRGITRAKSCLEGALKRDAKEKVREAEKILKETIAELEALESTE